MPIWHPQSQVSCWLGPLRHKHETVSVPSRTFRWWTDCKHHEKWCINIVSETPTTRWEGIVEPERGLITLLDPLYAACIRNVQAKSNWNLGTFIFARDPSKTEVGGPQRHTVVQIGIVWSEYRTHTPNKHITVFGSRAPHLELDL